VIVMCFIKICSYIRETRRLIDGQTDSRTDAHNHAQITSLLYASSGLADVGIIKIFYSIGADDVRA